MEGRGFICLLMFSLMLICDLNAMSIHGIPSAQHLDEGRKAELVLGSLFGKLKCHQRSLLQPWPTVITL